MPSATVFKRWLLQAGAPDAKAWTQSMVLYGAWITFAERAGERRGSLAWFASQMRAAGVALHRTKKAKGWRFALMDIEESIRAANLARQRAYKAGDAGALAVAVRQQMSARRRAGVLLDADPSSNLTLKFAKGASQNCRALARLSDDQFSARAEVVARRAVAALRAPRPGGTCPQIKMTITPWVHDSDGALTRTLTAVDDDR
jgi:hypothetical protein